MYTTSLSLSSLPPSSARWLSSLSVMPLILPTPFFFFQAEDGIRDDLVTGVQTCALPIYRGLRPADEFGLSLGEVAERVGRSKPTVSNRIRLLELPEDVLAMIGRHELTEGQDRKSVV